MKVITVLGLVAHTKGKDVVKEEQDKAVYRFGPRLQDFASKLPKDKRYINTLPLLCDVFGSKNIIPVYTDESKKTQIDVLRYEGIEGVEFAPVGYIADEKDFTAVFQTINNLLDENEKIIIDITHGFRHLPILMTISMIIENIKDINKIEHILLPKR